MVRDATWFTETPAGFRARDVVVRLARPDERRRWDDLVARHHYLGFKQFAGRGLRYVFEWRGMWLGAAGRQTGVFKCGPRDRWIRWPEGRQFERLHLIGNNTRFVLFGAAGVFPHLASHALSRMTRRPGDDWRERWGHGLLVAESFVDPRRFGGAMYRAAGWRLVGRSRGYSRSNGRYVREPGSGPKDLYVRPLGRDALRLLRRDGELGEGWRAKVGGTGVSAGALEGMVESLAGVADFRRAQGRRHSARVLLAVLLLSKLAGNDGPVAAAQYARGLSQRELAALGMTSDADASPERLLAWNRGHRHIEAHHNVRDGTFKEDACRLRTGHGPATSATINAGAIAVIKRYRAAHEALASLTIAEMRRHFAFHRREAMEAMLGAVAA